MASRYRRVFATEVSKALIDAATINAQLNAVQDRVAFARLSAEELSEALSIDGRAFRRLKGIDLKGSFDFKTVFVDPPRAGLGQDVAKFISDKFDRIIYVSCNDLTMIEDFDAALGKTHRITRFAAFDQFPYTNHIEVGALLERKQ